MAGRFLIATVDGGGTLPPELGLAAELVRRGHRVHLLADGTAQRSASAAGCGFTEWPTAPSVATIDDLTAQIRAFEHGPPWRRIAAVRDRVLVAPIPRYAADVVGVAGREGADVVLCEGVPGIVVGALATGCPVAVLMPNIYLRPTAGRPPMGTGWSPGRHRLIQLRNTLAGEAYARIIDTCVPAVNRAAAAYGVPPVAHTMDLYDRCARVLVMTSRAFDFEPDELPGNVRYTGPQLDDPDWAAPDPPQLDLLPPGSDPLVLVAMSSIFQNQTAVLRRVVAALDTLPVRGLVTTGRAVDPRQLRVPANVRAVRAAPHSALLPLAAAVITHAGHGTVLKALAAAVPLVCMPQGRDQKDNTARVLRLGAGVRVKSGSTPAAIAAAVRTVLEDPRYRAAATVAAHQLAQEGSQSPSAADETEALLPSAR